MATQKKTAEVDYSMQEKILALYELQKIDSRIDEINKVKGELPLEVQDLEDEVAGMKTRIEHINAEIEELNTLTKQRKREVDQARIMIGNYKEQQNNVRNNREFDAISKEIEYQELEIELAEKRLKEYAAGIKAKKLQLEEAEGLVEGRDRRAPAGGLRAYPPQRPQRTGRGDRQARRLRRLLQPHSAPAPGGHSPGKENHRLRVLRPYPGRRSRRGAGVGRRVVRHAEALRPERTGSLRRIRPVRSAAGMRSRGAAFRFGDAGGGGVRRGGLLYY